MYFHDAAAFIQRLYPLVCYFYEVVVGAIQAFKITAIEKNYTHRPAVPVDRGYWDHYAAKDQFHSVSFIKKIIS
jgi:hypothetical protein